MCVFLHVQCLIWTTVVPTSMMCVLCCLAPSLFETSVSTFQNFTTHPHKKHHHTSVQIQDFTAVSKVLHNLAISLVLTTSSVNKLHTPYTLDQYLPRQSQMSIIMWVNKLGGEAEVLMKLTTPGALPSP